MHRPVIMVDVAVINTNPDLMDALKAALEDEGLTVAVGYIVDLKRDPTLIAALMRRHQPRCIIFDVAPLYDVNWAWFREVFCTDPEVASRPIVVTSTNVRALNEVAGVPYAVELLGKPYDIGRLLEAVDRALLYSDSSSLDGRPA